MRTIHQTVLSLLLAVPAAAFAPRATPFTSLSLQSSTDSTELDTKLSESIRREVCVDARFRSNPL